MLFKKLKEDLFILSKKIFSISNFDNHKVIYILGFRIRKKLKPINCDLELNQWGLNKENREIKITVSLTTFPKRINQVSKTIKTLLKQTLKPDRVVLYLAVEQFSKKEEELPYELLNLKNYGLEIKWCNDIRSYKKLIPALKEFKDDIIITFDDDIYYPQNTIELLYNSYLKNPNCIHTNRARRLYIKNNKICAQPAAKIYWLRYNDCSFKNTITGCGGVLYPPNSLNEEVLNEEKFKKLLPTQDDVWFWAMAVLNNTKIKSVASFDISLPTVENTQQYGLSKINCKSKQGINSLDGINLITKEYDKILDKLKEEETKIE